MKRTGFDGRRYLPFVKFNIVGAANTLIDFAVYALLIRLDMNALAAQCVSYGIGAANSYRMNKMWTFQDRSRTDFGKLARFAALNLPVLALSVSLMSLILSVWPVSELFAKASVTMATTVINYLSNRRWVFNRVDLPEGIND